MVMYHGSYKHFFEFDINSEKVQRTNNFAGFYFTAFKDEAEKYYENGYIYECFLNLRKPISNNKPSDSAIKYIEDKYKNKYEEMYLRGKLKNLKSSWWVSFMDGMDSTKMAMIDGFDGFFDGAYEVCVFYPNRIKLADGSNTTFDVNNDDIRK